MKKELLFYSTLLAALVAQGADFDRATLDKMLADLERSGKPENLQPGALCYFMYISSPQRAEYICRSCGERTYFPRESDFELLHNARKNVKNLRKLGLEIKVNEQAFCHKCTPDQSAFSSQECLFSGVLTDNPYLTHPKYQPGSRVLIKSDDWERNSFRIAFLDYFIHKDFIDENGVLLKYTDAQIQLKPGGTDSHFNRQYVAGTQFSIQPAQPGDDPDWVRINLPDNLQKVEITVPKQMITDLIFKKLILPKEKAVIVPSWEITINGEKRVVPAKEYDVEILFAFFENKDRYLGSVYEEEFSLKDALPRLRELLGKLGDSP